MCVCVWLLKLEMDTVTRLQILDEAAYILQSVLPLGKGISPTILPPCLDKRYITLGSLTLICKPVLEKENSDLKTVRFHLKLTLSCILHERRCYIYIYIYIYIDRQSDRLTDRNSETETDRQTLRERERERERER